MKQTPESFKTYAAILHGVAKSTDVLIDVLLKAHDAVASLPSRADLATAYVESGIEKAVTVLSEYGDALEAKVDEVSKTVYGDSENHADGEPVVARHAKTDTQPEVKPEKPTADMSHEEKVQYIIDGYGLPDSVEQRSVLNRSSEAALTQAVNVLKRRNTLK